MTDPLLGPSQVRALADRLGVRPTKSLGQNFVVDPGTVRRIVRVARVAPGERVVEVGPGLGSLTLGLLEAGAEVVAVEIDPVLAAQLPATVAERLPDAADRLTVVGADALRVTELPGPPPTALVANLPYNVAVPVLLAFLERFGSLDRALVMVQAEVADRHRRAARLAHLRGPVGQGRVVRRRARGRQRRPGGVLAGAAGGLRAGRARTSRPAGRGPRAGVRGRRHRVRPAPQDAALGAGGRGGHERGRRPRP